MEFSFSLDSILRQIFTAWVRAAEMPCGSWGNFYHCIYHLFGVPLVLTNHTRKVFSDLCLFGVWFLSLPIHFFTCFFFTPHYRVKISFIYWVSIMQINLCCWLLLHACKRASPAPLPLHLLTREGQPPWGDLLKAATAQGSFSEKEEN